MGNPYVISFGTRPEQYIPRLEQRERVIQDFNGQSGANRAYMLIGVRGSGKTVLLSEITRNIGENWIVADISSQTDILRSLTAQLYSNPSLHKLFVKAKIDLSFMGMGIQLDASEPVFDEQTAISRMLGEIKRQGKRVLVTIDEVDYSDEIKKFASVFQILIRNELPIYLLMAGIPENIYGLMNEKRSTFLYRTPRILMTPLSRAMIRRSYMANLFVPEDTADLLADSTQGYPFAYQVLGYVCWGKEIRPGTPSFQEIMNEYDYYLQEFSYRKIWDEMSGLDRLVAQAISRFPENGVNTREVRELLEMDTKKFSVYRDRLIRKGIVVSEGYGKMRFALPRFREFLLEM